MMGQVARGRFAHWTDEDVGDLYAYLTDLSRRAVEVESQTEPHEQNGGDCSPPPALP